MTPTRRPVFPAAPDVPLVREGEAELRCHGQSLGRVAYSVTSPPSEPFSVTLSVLEPLDTVGREGEPVELTLHDGSRLEGRIVSTRSDRYRRHVDTTFEWLSLTPAPVADERE